MSNVRYGGQVKRVNADGRARDFEIFNDLPAGLREAMNAVPFQMEAGFARIMLDRGVSEAKLIEMLWERQRELAGDGYMPEQRIAPVMRRARVLRSLKPK